MSDAELTRTLRNRCGIPRHFARLELSDMDTSGDAAYRRQLAGMEDLAAKRLDTAAFFEDDPLFLYLNGSFGVGKTRVATWLAKRAFLGLRANRTSGTGPRWCPLFVPTNRLVEYRFQKRWDDEDAEEWNLFRDRMFSSRFLIIDDVGRISDFKGEMNFLERVVEERYNDELSTVITSNLDGKALKALAPRFADFMRMFTEITLNSATRREVR